MQRHITVQAGFWGTLSLFLNLMACSITFVNMVIVQLSKQGSS